MALRIFGRVLPARSSAGLRSKIGSPVVAATERWLATGSSTVGLPVSAESQASSDTALTRELHRIHVVGRCGLRNLVRPLGGVSAGVVLGVCHPVEPGDVGGRRDDKQLCILARVRPDRRAQGGCRDGGGGDNEQATRHRLQPIRLVDHANA